jgi:hypothetical protein
MVPEAVTAGLESNDNAFDSADERRILRGSRKLARLALDHTAVAKSHDQFRSYGIRLWSGLSLVSGAGLPRKRNWSFDLATAVWCPGYIDRKTARCAQLQALTSLYYVPPFLSVAKA